MKNKSGTIKKAVGISLLCIFIFASAYAVVKLMPWFISLKDEAVREALKERVSRLGFGGWLLLLCIQILQIVVAVLPGEPIELAAGYLFGVWGGLFTCLLGILIGTAIVFLIVRFFKKKIITLFIPQSKLDGFRFLKTQSRLESVTFLLFLIPGTPKDALTYAAALTRIDPLRFFVIATIARIPSVISSTWAGASIMRENWTLTAAIFIGTGALGLLGIWLNKKYTRRLGKEGGA